jgi:hypothetical protein
MNGDASKVNLVMTVVPFAGPGATFSDAVQYVFHVNSSAGYGQAQTESLIICQFPNGDPASAECWGGGQHVNGDATPTAGLVSSNGKFKVFAGLRDDPFFFSLDGFKEAVATVKSAAPSLTFDSNGCPNVNGPTSEALVGQLQSDGHGHSPVNTFAGANVMAIVIQIDKALVSSGGSTLGIWASTHRRQ